MVYVLGRRDIRPIKEHGSNMMKFEMVIDKKGNIVTEVLDRGQHLCSQIYQVTNALGRQKSDEEIGPECDSVTEVQGGA